MSRCWLWRPVQWTINELFAPTTDFMLRRLNPRPHPTMPQDGQDGTVGCWSSRKCLWPSRLLPASSFSPPQKYLLVALYTFLGWFSSPSTRKDFRRLETLYNLGANVCQQIFCQRQINGFLVNCRCPDIRLLSGKTNFLKSDLR